MELEGNLKKIKETIEKSCTKSGRDPKEVHLVAISKGHPPATVARAAELGVTAFGENKVQEAKAKIPLCPSSLQWHMVGHLQSNKVKDTLRLFQTIQSVDSINLASELQMQAVQEAKHVPIFMQVNVAGESSKFGFSPESLLKDLETVNKNNRLEVQGLMTIAPWTPDPEKVRVIFRSLRELKAKCEDFLGAPLAHLSMGMSGDFAVAVEEGATIVRIGTALFGPRK